jgi:hypothetical protein
VRVYVRRQATAIMQYTCRAERPSRPSYDDGDLLGTPGAKTVIWDAQPCRIWEIQGAQMVDLNGAVSMVENLQLSTPWNAPVLKRGDEIVITVASDEDTFMQGKRFQVNSGARAGALRATRRYNVKAVQK